MGHDLQHEIERYFIVLAYRIVPLQEDDMVMDAVEQEFLSVIHPKTA